MKLSKLVKVGLLASVVFAMAEISSAALVGYYNFNENNNPSVGTTVTNSASGSNNAIMTSDVLPAPGVGAVEGVESANTALYGTAFNFVNTNLSIADINPFSGLTRDGALTYAVWIKPTAAQLTTSTILGSTGRGYDLGITTVASELMLAFKRGTTGSVLSTVAITPDVWTHVAVTKTAGAGGATVQLYINGAPVTQDATTIIRAASGDPVRFFLGTGNGGNAPNAFNGGIDEVRLYDEVLDAATIAGLAVVPEPSAIVLAMCGVAGILGATIRKRAR